MLNANETNTDSVLINIGIYLDDTWEEALAASDCVDKLKISKREKTIKVPYNGDWSIVTSGTLS